MRSGGVKGIDAQSMNGTLSNKTSATLNIWCTYEALTQCEASTSPTHNRSSTPKCFRHSDALKVCDRTILNHTCIQPVAYLSAISLSSYGGRGSCLLRYILR